MARTPVMGDRLIKPAFTRIRHGRATRQHRGPVIAAAGADRRWWPGDDSREALRAECERFITATMECGSSVVQALRELEDELVLAGVPETISQETLKVLRSEMTV